MLPWANKKQLILLTSVVFVLAGRRPCIGSVAPDISNSVYCSSGIFLSSQGNGGREQADCADLDAALLQAVTVPDWRLPCCTAGQAAAAHQHHRLPHPKPAIAIPSADCRSHRQLLTFTTTNRHFQFGLLLAHKPAEAGGSPGRRIAPPKPHEQLPPANPLRRTRQTVARRRLTPHITPQINQVKPQQ
jgi:hypothetical protein